MSPMVKAPLTMEYALLGFLCDAPMHAYEMHQKLRQPETLGLVWRIKQSQLYALLARLEEVGFLTMVTAPQETRPARKMLHLTESGRAAFETWRETPVQHGRDLRQEFLAKLYFAHLEGAACVAKLVEAQRTVCRTMLAGLQARADGAKQPYARLVYEFRFSQVKATFEWLDRCESILFPTTGSTPANIPSSSAKAPSKAAPTKSSSTKAQSTKDHHLPS